MKETGLKLKNRDGSGRPAALWRGLLMAALLLLFVTGLSGCGKREVVLEFAMFNGSNWDVAIQDSYPPIDEAIRCRESGEKKVILFSFFRNAIMPDGCYVLPYSRR